MKEQMKKAGITPAAETLAEIAAECAALHKKNRKLAADMLWQKIGSDAQLMWEAFKDYRQDAARRLLDKAYAGLMEGDTQVVPAGKGSGPLASEHHEKAAASHSSSDATSSVKNHVLSASEPARDHPGNDIQKSPVPRRTAPIVSAAVREVVRLSILDTFRVTARQGSRTPIGDVYISSVGQWAERMGKNAYVNARERELMLMIHAACSKQARIPADAKVRDIFSAEEILGFINTAGGVAKHPELSGFFETLTEEAHAN